MATLRDSVFPVPLVKLSPALCPQRSRQHPMFVWCALIRVYLRVPFLLPYSIFMSLVYAMCETVPSPVPPEVEAMEGHWGRQIREPTAQAKAV